MARSISALEPVPDRSLDGQNPATAVTRRRYDRIASVYDLIQWPVEQLAFRRWRRQLWSRVEPGDVLELGVGTGKNLPYYPPGIEVTAIDISPRMLARARRRAARTGANVRLELADAQQLPYADASFDTLVSTFVFCSVPDPIQALREASRVLRPGGRLLLLEHVASGIPVIGTLLRWLDPIFVRIWGAHLDRRTVDNVRASGLVLLEVRDRFLDVVKEIVATRPA